MKKAEHFWKGLSNPKSQISPVPPLPYGERFLKFITGITRSPEEAAREKESQAHDAEGIAHQTLRSSSSDPQTDKVMRKAEKQAEKSERAGAKESRSPDRTLGTVRSPSAERSGGIAGQTLPVVEEAGEAGSTSGRSRTDSFRKEEGEEETCNTARNSATSGMRASTEAAETDFSKTSSHLDKAPRKPLMGSPPVSPMTSAVLKRGPDVEDLEFRVARVSESTTR